MAETTLRRRKAGVYGVEVVVPRYWAFIDIGGDLIAAIYSDAGGWMSNRATQSFGTMPNETAFLIRTDSSATVGDGSLAWAVGDDGITVWDVEGATVYTYTATASDYVSPPVFSDGYLYWWEVPATTDGGGLDTFYLRRARADLDSPTTIGSFDIDHYLTSVDWEDQSGSAAIADETALVCWPWTDAINSEVTGFCTAVMDLDGMNQDADDDHEWGNFCVGYEFGAGQLVAVPGGGDDVGELSVSAVGVGAALAVTWPVGWSGMGENGAHCGLDSTGAIASLYSGANASPVTIVEASPTATAGDPDRDVTVTPYPPTLDPPTLMYIMEDA